MNRKREEKSRETGDETKDREHIELKKIIAYLTDAALPHNPVICQQILTRLDEVLEIKDDKGNQIYTLDFVKKRCLQTLPSDVADDYIALQRGLSASGKFDLGNLERKFAGLRDHNGIKELYPEFAASSVYEAYFDNFSGKVDALIKTKGKANADEATSIIEKLAQNSKTKLDKLVEKECSQDASSTDACFHLRKGSLTQDLEDAFNNFDSSKFMRQLDELSKLRQVSPIFDESTHAINSKSLFYKPEGSIKSYAKSRFDDDPKLQAQVADALASGDLPTQVGKLCQLELIYRSFPSYTPKIISDIRENLLMDVIDPHIIKIVKPEMGIPDNTADLAALLKSKISGMDPNDKAMPYFLSKASKEDILKFWAIQRYKISLTDPKIKSNNTSKNFAIKFAGSTNVKSILGDELAKLCTSLEKNINSTPPNYDAFMGHLNLIVRLRRSLDKNFTGFPTLDGDEHTQIKDIIEAKLISLVDNTKHDYSNEVETLLKMGKEIIYGELKYPNIEIEIKTKDDYTEVRRAKIVKTHFTNVNQGEFASNLGPINAQLKASGMEEIDAAKLCWLLLKVNMCEELVTSDDSSHSQYTAIKTEVANKLKRIVENLDETKSVYHRYSEFLENLIRAWRKKINAPDTIEPNDVSKYVRKLISKMISNLRNNLVGAETTTVIEKAEYGYEIAKICYISEEVFKQSLISEDKARFFASENTSTYDKNTNLSEDAYFKSLKACPFFISTPDKEIVWNLVKDHLDDPSNTRAHNLYVYHYLMPSMNDYECMASHPDTSRSGKIGLYDLIIHIDMKIVPIKALALKMLETQTIAGKEGSGVALFWHEVSVNNDLISIFNTLKDEASVVDNFILEAVDELKSTYEFHKDDTRLKNVYEDNYESLKKQYSGDPKTFPLLT